MSNRLKFSLYYVLIIAIAVIAYKYFNPIIHANFFPKCPIKEVTGLDCPGCGGQRAAHLFLSGAYKEAFLQNPLIILLVPYIFIGFYVLLVPSQNHIETKLKNLLYSKQAMYIALGILISFMIIRNINGF